MGQTIKRNYDRYTLEYKRQAVKLANHPGVKAKDIAESLGVHPVMLYRWRMEQKNGVLKENKNMKPKKPSPTRLPNQIDPLRAKEDELRTAQKRIKQLERALDNRTEELDLLKKAERFLAKKTKK